MGWANHLIDKLRRGETVTFRPRGSSMTPIIKSGQLCTVEPVDHFTLKINDVVLCKVGGAQYLHLVKGIDGAHTPIQYQIGNNHGRINGWVGPGSIFGKLVKVED